MSFRSRNRSWLVISDWKRLCKEEASSWIRLRVGVLSWHSISSCSLLVFLSIVPFCDLRLFSFRFRTARHQFVRALPNSSIRIHCIPCASWFVRVAGGVFVVSEFCRNISFTVCDMLIVHSSPCQPCSMWSSIFLFVKSNLLRYKSLKTISIPK